MGRRARQKNTVSDIPDVHAGEVEVIALGLWGAWPPNTFVPLQ